MRCQVAVAEVRERQLPRLGRHRLHVGGGLAVVLEEGHDVEAGRQLDQSLPQSHQQAIKLCGFCFGLLAGDLAERQGALLAVVAEEDAVASASLFETGHRCGSNVTATLLPVCYQGGQFGRLRFDASL